MNTVFAIFVRRPVFTLVLAIAIVVAGLASLRGLPLERYPNIDIPVVTITTLAPGLSASQVEAEVTTRIENAAFSASGLERSDSSSQEGISVVIAQFVLEKDGAVAAQDIRDKVARIATELPPSARTPSVELFNANAAPVLTVAVRSGKGRSLREISELAEIVVKRDIQSVKGVGDVKVVGAVKRAFRIALDPLRLASYDLTPSEVRDALARENVDVPGGTLSAGHRDVSTRIAARAATASDLAHVVLVARGPRGSPVRLSDIADVVDGEEEPASVALLDGEGTVLLAVVKQSGENTLAVVHEVRARLSALSARLPADVTLSVVRDESVFVEASLDAVREHLILGSIFAAIVVLVFLRSGRATVIAALAIPTSIVGTFAFVKALGMSLNMLSLLGLTLAVGIVIDDAVVVLENVVRVLSSGEKTPEEAAISATREISLAVLATTLSLVAVFLPVAFMGGLVGRFLASFGLTMSASILLSMAVAFTLTPMLCGRWLKREKTKPIPIVAAPMATEPRSETETYASYARGERDVALPGETSAHEGLLERMYGRVLGWVMTRRWVVGIAMLVTLGSIVPLGAAVPKNFLPVEDEARLEVYVRLPQGTSLEASRIRIERLARAVRALPDVEHTTVTVGSPKGDASGRGPNEGSIYVSLSRRGAQAARVASVRELALSMGKDALVLVNVVSDFGSAGVDGTAIQYVLRGPDVTELARLGEAMLHEARAISGTADHGTTMTTGSPELRLVVDHPLAAELGVSHADLGALLRLASREGTEVGSVRDPLDRLDVSHPVLLTLAGARVPAEDSARGLTARTSRGSTVTLGELATATEALGPPTIRRTNRERQVTVFMNTLPGGSDGAVVDALDRASSHLLGRGLPPGYRAEVIGNAKEMEKATDAFLTAIVLSFVFMFLVLAAQFESFRHPITILASLPLTVPFALLSLLIGGQSLNLFSGLGFLVLFGIVKKNAILQVDHTLALRRRGLSRADAVIVANRHRLRPILMTTLAFVAGLLPLVVSSGPGSGTNRAIAVGVIGGQTLALLLTLLATPVLYTWLDDFRLRSSVRERLDGLWKRVRAKATSAGPKVVPTP